jgi:hypothetical protein
MTECYELSVLEGGKGEKKKRKEKKHTKKTVPRFCSGTKKKGSLNLNIEKHKIY